MRYYYNVEFGGNQPENSVYNEWFRSDKEAGGKRSVKNQLKYLHGRGEESKLDKKQFMYIKYSNNDDDN